jgi:hypothetical protein
MRLELCEDAGADCFGAALSPWGETQAAAEEAYDRSAACEFTSFVGYEHTAQTGAGGLFSMHRNVIFRNANVPRVPASYFETAAESAAPAEVGSQLWAALDADCTEADFGCEALTIPHNPNGSGGLLFLDPANAEDARQRRRYDALVEMIQVKGGSECRFDRLAGRGAFTTDELCAFEQMPTARTLALGGNLPRSTSIRGARSCVAFSSTDSRSGRRSVSIRFSSVSSAVRTPTTQRQETSTKRAGPAPADA